MEYFSANIRQEYIPRECITVDEQLFDCRGKDSLADKYTIKTEEVRSEGILGLIIKSRLRTQCDCIWKKRKFSLLQLSTRCFEVTMELVEMYVHTITFVSHSLARFLLQKP